MKNKLLLAAVGLAMAGCVGVGPSLSRDEAVQAARSEAARRFPTADLSRPRTRDLGDRWEVAFEPAAGARSKPIVVLDKRSAQVIRTFDWRFG